MKRIVIAAVVGLILVVIVSGAYRWHQGRHDPQTIINRLTRGRGDRQDLIMQLQLARGDVVGAIRRSLADETIAVELRRDMMELIFRRFKREPDEEFKSIIFALLKDEDVQIRRHATYFFAAYCDIRQHPVLIDSVVDPDPEVRRNAYPVFLASRDNYSLWKDHMTDEQRTTLVQHCVRQMAQETDDHLKLLARCVVGSQISYHVGDARSALQRGDIARAQDLLQTCFKLDPDNQSARTSLVRYHLALEDPARALETAKQYGALMVIPRLPRKPEIDGDPTEPVWEAALRVDPIYVTTSNWTAMRAKGKTEIFIGHHDGVIYLAARNYEDDLDKLAVKHMDRDANVWKDDCVEYLFDPEAKGESAYQFCINAAGAVWDSLRYDRSKNFRCVQAANIYRDRGYWGVEFAVPFAELTDKKVTADTIWGVNVFRARIGPESEHLTYWPTFGGTHQYWFYPLAVFEGVGR